ncbi:MAG: radical SAM family heme chaperone HemW [Lachnospiraceae bacterium]|nr:radical SAM family heme chaperone HemW [Lachnospiraceae bacterium]
MSINGSELYIHIPFCVRKCLYCDFLSFPADDAIKEKYVEALCEEILCAGEERRGASLSSVFIGGGTPSILPGEAIRRIMGCVREAFDVDADAEMTIECNPGTVSEEKLGLYRECGINRVSFGLQSADDSELKRLGRIHTFDDFVKSYEMAVSAGFANINVDLMSDIPGQTLSSWEDTLRKVCFLDPAPAHISAYSLIVEEGTPFGDMQEEGRLDIPDEETDREMYHMTARILSGYGYDRYEISNYARPGYECRHNVGYWTGIPYYGAGIDAASYYGHCRYVNSDDIESYMKDPGAGHILTEKLGTGDLMSEFMILGLRMIKGVSFSEFEKRFGMPLRVKYGHRIEGFVKDGLLEEDGDALRLSERGLDLANVVMRGFI